MDPRLYDPNLTFAQKEWRMSLNAVYIDGWCLIKFVAVWIRVNRQFGNNPHTRANRLHSHISQKPWSQPRSAVHGTRRDPVTRGFNDASAMGQEPALKREPKLRVIYRVREISRGIADSAADYMYLRKWGFCVVIKIPNSTFTTED